jgi:pimeloyl-ACP methyl ester carboxylesterase
MNDIVLIHGALGAARQFDFLEPLLSKHYTVHVYEIPGHGSRANENIDFAIENFAMDLEKFLQKLKSPKVFGFSMGGYVGLYLAKTKPHLFGEILTLGTKFLWNPEEAEKETGKLNVEVLETKVPQYCAYLHMLHADKWKMVVNNTKKMMVQLGNIPLLTPVLVDTINIPVTIMVGELDKMVTRKESIAIQQKIPGSQFKVLNGFVHPLEKLDPVLLSKQIQ